MATTLRTTVIGGSNTVMEPGYLGQMLAAAARQGVTLDIVENLAVGGTTSAYGLFRLKTSDALERSDLLVIEYALNDAFIYGDERRQFRHWSRIYEGILRYALTRNPRLKICTLILGARNGSWLGSVPSIDAGIRYLSDWYGTIVVDISRDLMRRFGRDVVTDPGFYVDQGHYARPVATAMVADLAADGLISGLSTSTAGMTLPPPVDPDHFAEAGTIDVPALFAAAPDAPLVEYHNRRFAFTAIDIARHRLELELSGGKLLGVFHMSAPNMAPLMLARGETGHHCSLLKAGVRDGKFKFLAGMLPCEFLYGADLLQKTASERFTLARAGDDPALKTHIAKDNVASRPGIGSEVLPLIGLLYSGTRRGFSIVTEAPQPHLRRAANSA
ncbi:SGNH/GDSL hydrolase family protein [Dongia rigui]|uniref:SGNH/GDSL hydrolase family protein n=1 Tax=Dongia rigui TaxID=940149 RepID=A0ABU5DVH8_9PROT|nr:SGNH/GDSL hydrolase family protein [Dongia rigui]MDY0870934.1 SGNH/GDSL hydrolase family protein [Dongia rigui]